MLNNAQDYLPIGSVVLLKGGIKKVMIIGIMPTSPESPQPMDDFDYIGVMYPEGFLDVKTMLLVKHDTIFDVVFRGYENPERGEFLNVLEKNMRIMSESSENPKSAD